MAMSDWRHRTHPADTNVDWTDIPFASSNLGANSLNNEPVVLLQVLNGLMKEFPSIRPEMDAYTLLSNQSMATIEAFTTAPPMIHNSSNSTNSTDIIASPPDVFEIGTKIFVIVFGTVLSILTAGGNLMVMISFKIDRQLQTISNYFLMSLAVADVTIGCISIPLMTYYTANGGWRLGYVMCQFWLCVDYLMCNASVLNLLLISFDRYFSITRPLTYRPRRTPQKALTMIAVTYFLSIILWPPWIVLWPYMEGVFAIPPDQCMVQFFLTSPIATIGTALAAFYLPVAIMVYLYASVYMVTRNRRKELAQFDASAPVNRGKDAITPAGIEDTSQGGGSSQSRRPSATALTSKSQNSIAEVEKNRLEITTIVESDESPCRSPRFRAAGSIRRRFVHWTHRMTHSASPRRAQNVPQPPTLIDQATFMRDESKDLLDPPPPYHHDMKKLFPGPVNENLRRKSFDAIKHTPEMTEAQLKSATAVVTTDKASSAVLRKLNNDEEMDPLKANGGTYTVLICLDPNGNVPRTVSSETASTSGQTDNRSPQETEQPGMPRARSQSLAGEKEPPVKVETEAARERRELREREQKAAERAARLHNSFRPGSIAVDNSPNSKHNKKARRSKSGKGDSKAAKTLSAILAAFVFTWTPYNILVCIYACGGEFPDYLWTFCYFLCYINSTINPFCYAFANAQFRRTYTRILKCQWRERRGNGAYFAR